MSDSQAVRYSHFVFGDDWQVANERASVVAPVDSGDGFVCGPRIDEVVRVVHHMKRGSGIDGEP
jgi:hypothetical protein